MWWITLSYPALTHYLCIKVLAATLKGRWLMPMAWLLESAAAGKVLPEGSLGGSRLTVSPFNGRSLLMSKDFVQVSPCMPSAAATNWSMTLASIAAIKGKQANKRRFAL